MKTTVSIVIPTRGRPAYLEVALASIAPQAAGLDAEVVVVDDAANDGAVGAIASRFGARHEAHRRPLGLNVARNTGVERSHGDLVVFVDDDVEVCDGWLEAFVHAAESHPHTDVFAGRIQAALEGGAPRSCGREGAPITTLDLGPSDTSTAFAWGSNMAVRRSALERVGPFEVALEGAGDEQEWQERLSSAGGGAVRYVANACVKHRRSGEDARLRALVRAGRARGGASRRFDAWRGEAPPLTRELSTLARCVAHVLLRRCPTGLVMVAHSFGRVEQGGRERLGWVYRVLRKRRASRGRARARNTPFTESSTSPALAPAVRDDFLSGESGTVGGLDGMRRALLDTVLDELELRSGVRRRLAAASARFPPTRKILVLGVQRPQRRELAAGIRDELARSRHELELHFEPPGERGKFENLNALLHAHPAEGSDWLLLIDDDIELPDGFLDRFIFLIERFELDLAQPAQSARSHAAWRVTRRRAFSVLRETRFVEIGPLTALSSRTFQTLLPFPPLRMGWGLDVHWGALALEHGWRCGIADAVSISHRQAPAGSAYPREAALAEAREFLANRPHLSACEAQQAMLRHRRW